MKIYRPKFQLWVIICLLLFPALLMTGCSQPVKEKLTLDNLDGKKVGVMCGYSADYLLSDEKYDVQLLRYDYYADMQLALRFHRIDAAAMEMDEAYVFCRIEPMFEIGLVPSRQTEFVYLFNSQKTEFLEQFNSFVREFRQTEEYADMLRRVEESADAPFVPRKVENTITTDRVLKIAAFDGWEPVSYINASTHEWEGVDVELVTHFANSLGANLELIDESWSQMLIEIGSGLVDIMLCPLTSLSRKDLEMSGNITLSDCVFYKDIVLIVNKEGS